MYLRGLAFTIPQMFTRRARLFEFAGHRYKYFSHRYNATWMNERISELPVALRALREAGAGNVLEVGNVLSHYENDIRHDIVVRYESGDARVLNVDARVFKPSTQYDLILSISTLEHVGWDESPRDENKAWETILHLSSLLAPDGRFVFTVPAGYHPNLNRSILANAHRLGPLRALRRVSIGNAWQECSPEVAAQCEFGKPYPFANAVFVGSVGSGTFA